ncbi:MAG: sigma-54 dependent transcriptional regulator, partial [Acidobacteriota bacterium]|nr:sigma-54 dependent transcriptional regulator [Acidobacteriota bacterium]
EDGIRSTLSEILQDEGYRTSTAASVKAARSAVEDTFFDLAILDIWLPDGDGLDFLQDLQREHAETPVLVISGHANIDTAVKALHLGAYDFLEKPLSLSRVLVTVQNALERSRLSRELRQLSQRLDHGETLIGTSEGMQKLKDELKTAAGADTRILITGENGTGKELVARQIHRLSNRREGPFVEVNCAAIPEELIESELFGHVRGSFTGASSDRRGRFEESNGGTLFLDEVADMSLKTQAKVLRALEEQRFQRVGSADLIEVDVRVLAATNKELEEEIRAERFREDLYFRLAVIPLGVPALRQRPADVPLLAAHFIDQFARELGRRPKTFDDAAMATLQAYGWPGNVRELRNLMERLMIMVPGEVITDVDLPPSLKGASAGRTPSQPAQLGSYDSLKAARDAFEVDYIRRELDLNDGKVSRTADALQIERSHLYRKMKSLGIR